MILWRLHGYADPEGEYARSEVVCSIERVTSRYRLRVKRGGTVQINEPHASATAAQEKAEALRTELLKQGWTAE
jgi:hypothetical protein